MTDETAEALNNETESPAVEGATQGDATPADSPSEERANGAQKRIGELTFKWRETERERDELLNRVRELETAQQPVAQQEPTDSTVPRYSDFDSDDDYSRAMAEHAERVARDAAQRVIREQQEQQRQDQARTSLEERTQTYRDRVNAYIAENPEMAEALERTRPPLNTAMRDYLFSSDEAAPITHFLANNPDRAARIASMSDMDTIKEMARIEADIQSLQPKTISDAPPPLPDVEQSTPEGDSLELSDDIPASEWLRRRRAQLNR